jgi:hypothetical protein
MQYNSELLIPDLINEAIKKTFPDNYQIILQELKWNVDHYYFFDNNVYVGIDTDGYIYT